MALYHIILMFIKNAISLSGILVIFVGVIIGLAQFIQFMLSKNYRQPSNEINLIRLRLGRILILV